MVHQINAVLLNFLLIKESQTFEQPIYILKLLVVLFNYKTYVLKNGLREHPL